MIEEWRRLNIETAIRILCHGATTIEMQSAVSFLRAALLPDPDNYEKLRDLPGEFIAEYQGNTVRCEKAEHVNLGRGWHLFVDAEGGTALIGEGEISNPRLHELGTAKEAVS